jgi:MFS family permease
MPLGTAALLSMLWLQIANSLAWMTFPVLAPQIARIAGVEPSMIGHVAGVMFAGALLPTLLSGAVIPLIGPVRVNQITTCIAALGLLVATVGSWPALLIGGVIVGAGYGPGAPAASAVLAHHTALARRGLIFSVRQSGAPLGGLLAGAMLPVIAVAFGTTEAILAAAAFSVLAAIIVQTVRNALDAPLLSKQRPSRANVLGNLSIRSSLAAHADLPRVTYNGFAAAAAQGSVFALMVTFLVERGGLDLITAGFVFAAMNVAGVVARIALGYASDGFVSAQTLLAMLAAVGVCALALLLALAGQLPLAAVLALASIIGATISGWNGVLMAELARLAPPELVGSVSAAAVTCIYLGYMVGPIVTSAVVGASGSYLWGFAPVVLALLAAAAAQVQYHRRISPGPVP